MKYLSRDGAEEVTTQLNYYIHKLIELGVSKEQAEDMVIFAALAGAGELVNDTHYDTQTKGEQ